MKSHLPGDFKEFGIEDYDYEKFLSTYKMVIS